MKVPCKDCTTRNMTCHSTCDKYEEFNKSRQLINNKRRKEIEKRDMYAKSVARSSQKY